MWDFTSSPSLLLVRTERDCMLNVTWEKYLEANGTSIAFSTEPIYIFGVILDKVSRKKLNFWCMCFCAGKKSKNKITYVPMMVKSLLLEICFMILYF